MYEFLSKLHSIISISKKTPPINNSTPINFKTISKENYHFIHPIIRQHIESLEKTGRIYSFQLNGRNIKLYIILPNEPKKQKTRQLKPNYYRKTRINRTNYKTTSSFQDYYKIAFSIIHFFIGQYTPPNTDCSTDLSIYLYLTELKKTLPSVPGKSLDELNVNTGFTFGCSLKNDIYIFRKEEWSKVLIHEIIHALGLDFASYPELNAVANRRMLEFFRITEKPTNSDLRLYEAYTETWATILNILFQVKLAKQIPSAIQRQQAWSLNQYIKIIKYYKFDEKTLIKNERLLILKEETTLYSYYILKCRLLFSIDEFFKEVMLIKKIKPYDDSLFINPINIINFVKTSESINSFIDFIQNNVYSTTNHEFNYLFKSIGHLNNKTEFLFIGKDLDKHYGINSLRMTI